jgi:predicted nucleic acid-binding protein
VKSIVLADAGPIIALFNPRDLHHQWAVARYNEFVEPLVTTEAVLSEGLHLLQRAGDAGEKLLALWLRGLLIVGLSAEAEKAPLGHLLRRYRDVPMSLADAGLVRLSELHANCVVWTVDANFRIYRRNGRQTIPLIIPS